MKCQVGFHMHGIALVFLCIKINIAREKKKKKTSTEKVKVCCTVKIWNNMHKVCKIYLFLNYYYIILFEAITREINWIIYLSPTFVICIFFLFTPFHPEYLLAASLLWLWAHTVKLQKKHSFTIVPSGHAGSFYLRSVWDTVSVSWKEGNLLVCDSYQ